MTTDTIIRIGIVYLLVSLPPASAVADAALPDCGRNTACKSLFDQAKMQSSSGNLPEALRLYKLAYEVEADPALLFSIGRVLHKQANTNEAATYYQRFLDSGLQDPEQRKRAQLYLSQFQAADRSANLTTAEQTPPMPASEGQPVKTFKPVYKKWWFWTLLSTVAAGAIAGGVAGGVLGVDLILRS